MLTDDDISDEDWGTVSATADKLYANNSPMSSKRSQSFGSGSLPSPPEPKRPRHDSTEPPDCGPLHADNPESYEALLAGYTSVKTLSANQTVDRLMTMGTQGVDQSLRSKKKKPAYYVVWIGNDWGIFETWEECKALTSGVPDAKYRGVKSYEEAVQLLRKELDAKNVGHLHEMLRAKLKQKIKELFPDRPSPVEDYEPIPLPGEPVLCEEQQDAMKLALRGHNLFITGSGGCGKSVLIKALYMNFRARGKKVHLVAPTGLAALNIGGHTTFNYAGWTPNDLKRPFEKLEKKSRGDRIYKRFRDTDVIIIDEISMVENQFFDRLSLAVSSVRCSIEESAGRPRPEGPFGGVQVIAVGDFCQLPPVEPFKYCLECGNKMKDKLSKEDVVLSSCPKGHGDFEVQDKWAFKSSEWEKCKFTYVHLKKIHRQQDEQFIRVLQRCRLGEELDKSDIDLLLKRHIQTQNGTPKDGTRLFSRRDDVDDYNEMRFNNLPGKLVMEYHSWDDFRFPDKNGISNKGEPEKEKQEKEKQEKEKREKEEREKEEREKNVPNKNESKKPIRETPDERAQREKACLKDHRYSPLLKLKVNMPVILLANVDLARKLCNGSQGVVCGFEKLPPEDSPKAPQRESYIEDPDGYRVAKERYRLLKHYIDSKESPSQFPVVQFDNGQRRVIGPDAMVSESGEKSPYCLLSRTQIPLAPGWAMTIHKSQSLSLDRVIVNLARAFEKGQAYVALSRARSLEGLKIEGTSEKQLKEAMKLDPTVKKFMEEIDALMAARAGTSIQSSKN